jgi:hypothetical protein
MNCDCDRCLDLNKMPFLTFGAFLVASFSVRYVLGTLCGASRVHQGARCHLTAAAPQN